jgi:hypothetical protein
MSFGAYSAFTLAAGSTLLCANLAAGQTLTAKRAEAAEHFGARFEHVRMAAEHLRLDEHVYQQACRHKTTSAVAFSGPGIPINPALVGLGAMVIELRNETTPECRALRTRIAAAQMALSRESAAIDEDARRRGIYPGLIRELRARYLENR